MDLMSLADILMLAFVVALIALLTYMFIYNAKKNKIFKNAVKEKCPECGIPMQYRRSFSRAWECPDCKTEILLLLDKNKKVVKLECVKKSNKYRNLWIIIFILTYTTFFAATLFGPRDLGYTVVGFIFIIAGILTALGVLPPTKEYDGRSLDNVILKHSVVKIRLFNCGSMILFAVFLICMGMEINLEYLVPLVFLFSICCAYMIYISEHNVISEK